MKNRFASFLKKETHTHSHNLIIIVFFSLAGWEQWKFWGRGGWNGRYAVRASADRWRARRLSLVVLVLVSCVSDSSSAMHNHHSQIQFIQIQFFKFNSNELNFLFVFHLTDFVVIRVAPVHHRSDWNHWRGENSAAIQHHRLNEDDQRLEGSPRAPDWKGSTTTSWGTWTKLTVELLIGWLMAWVTLMDVDGCRWMSMAVAGSGARKRCRLVSKLVLQGLKSDQEAVGLFLQTEMIRHGFSWHLTTAELLALVNSLIGLISLWFH